MSRVSGLSYVGATITDAAPWHELLPTVFGLERRTDSRDGLHQYRLDEHRPRLALEEGDVDKVPSSGGRWRREKISAKFPHGCPRTMWRLSLAGARYTKNARRWS